MHIRQPELHCMEKRKRALFVNSLSGFKSANLVGTVDSKGINNLAIVSSVFHLGADPALMGMIFRPNTVTRDTLENILETQYFTLNGVSANIIKPAHQTSARYLPEQSEFEEVGLTPVFTDSHSAPYVKESPLHIGLKYVEHQTLQVNGTVMVIGEIVEVITEDNALHDDGYLNVEALGLVAVSSLDSYHQTQQIARLSYAKPDKPIQELP